MKRFYFIPVMFLLFISGCMMGPNYQRPVLENPAAFRYDSLRSDSVINLAWWDLFEDTVLHQLVYEALNNNLNLKTAAAGIEEARAVLGFTKADMYPFLDYTGSATRTNLFPGTNVPSDARNNFIGALALNWEIDFWGKYRRANEAARNELLASEYGRRAVAVSLIAEVANSYFLLLDYQQRLAIARRTVVSRRESVSIIGDRFDKGYSPEIDLNQAQIQEAIAAAAVPVYFSAIAKIEHALSVLIGRNPGPVLTGTNLSSQVVPPDIPAGIPSDLLQRRPDVLESEALLAAQTARIGIAEALRWPSISLTGVLGLASADLSTFISGESVVWGGSGSLLGPLYHFGKNKRRVEIERTRTEQLLYQYRQNILSSFAEVENALVDIHTVREEKEARIMQMNAAINAANLSRERYDGGVTSYLEVLDSERSMFDAELGASEVTQRQLNNYVYLYKALGGGWITAEERDMSENQEQE
jgi:outer membrane protein, multidrug efflux system